MSADPRYRADAAAHQVAFIHEYFRAEWQEDVQTGAEADHADQVSLGAGGAFDGVTLYPAGNYPGNLAEKNVCSAGCSDRYAGMLILVGAFGIHGEDFAAGVVFDIADLAGHWIPVDMHVEECHED